MAGLHGNSGRKRPDVAERNRLSAKHGMNKTPTWKSWSAMRDRCLTPTNKDYKNYGARGIAICPEWATFEEFLKDMGMRPPGASLGRIDNDGNYCPANCRWETPSQQKYNKRTTRIIVLSGRPMPLKEWAKELQMSHQALRYRLKMAWPDDAIKSLPINHANRIKKERTVAI